MKDKEKEYLDVMLKFVRRAGALSLLMMKASKPTVKGDRSVLTKTDSAIAKLSRNMLNKFLEEEGHLLIEEEDPGVTQYLDQEMLNQKEYIWAVDPIDGTRLYANGVSTFAVSIGLMKNLKPYMGAVFFPALNELFYCDGKKAYYVKNAFTPRSRRERIHEHKKEVGPLSLFFCDDDIFRHFDWDYKDCQVVVTSCATADLCWCAYGRGCGALFRANLWDFAGSWAVFTHAGLDLRSFESGEVLTHLDVQFFNPNKPSWKVNDFYILSTRKNYEILKNKMLPKLRSEK